MKRINLFNKISSISIIVAVILAIIRSMVREMISDKLLNASLYISVILGMLFIIFTILSYIEKKRLEKKSKDYDSF